MNGPILVLGAGGMLATSLAQRDTAALDDSAWTFLSQSDLDLTDAASVAAALDRLGPRWVINASGYTNVDGAESAVDEAFAINARAVGDLARLCARRSITLVHYSTDYVFSGRSDRPWREDDPTDPVNAYGRSKLAGEIALRESGVEHLLIRTSWLYAAHGRNFVRTIRDRLLSGRALRVVSDQRGRPTSADDLAAMTVELADRGVRGTIHVANEGETTWFEFAAAIRDACAPGGVVEPCATSEYPTPARRPACSTLDLSRLRACLGSRPRHWRDALADVLDRLEQTSGGSG